MSQQNDIFQLPRHTSSVQQLAHANKIGKTTVVFAKSVDSVNNGVEKLNKGFLYFLDWQMNSAKVRSSQKHVKKESFVALQKVKQAILEEVEYLFADIKTFLKHY